MYVMIKLNKVFDDYPKSDIKVFCGSHILNKTDFITNDLYIHLPPPAQHIFIKGHISELSPVSLRGSNILRNEGCISHLAQLLDCPSKYISSHKLVNYVVEKCLHKSGKISYRLKKENGHFIPVKYCVDFSKSNITQIHPILPGIKMSDSGAFGATTTTWLNGLSESHGLRKILKKNQNLRHFKLPFFPEMSEADLQVIQDLSSTHDLSSKTLQIPQKERIHKSKKEEEEDVSIALSRYINVDKNNQIHSFKVLDYIFLLFCIRPFWLINSLKCQLYNISLIKFAGTSNLDLILKYAKEIYNMFKEKYVSYLIEVLQINYIIDETVDWDKDIEPCLRQRLETITFPNENHWIIEKNVHLFREKTINSIVLADDTNKKRKSLMNDEGVSKRMEMSILDGIAPWRVHKFISTLCLPTESKNKPMKSIYSLFNLTCESYIKCIFSKNTMHFLMSQQTLFVQLRRKYNLKTTHFTRTPYTRIKSIYDSSAQISPAGQADRQQAFYQPIDIDDKVFKQLLLQNLNTDIDEWNENSGFFSETMYDHLVNRLTLILTEQ